MLFSKTLTRRFSLQRKRVALLSVYRKEGIIEFARALLEMGWKLISSGGTARHLREAGLSVTDVAEISGLPPVLGHRVVTLVPQIHGGLLALPEMIDELERLGYPWIDLACVDLYPLEAEIQRAGATLASVLDKMDIGGPTMISSASKGQRIVIADPLDRFPAIERIKAGTEYDPGYIEYLGAKADGIVAAYRLLSARYRSNGGIDGMIGSQVQTCLYGENAWQTPAGLFTCNTDDPLALSRFELIEGTPPSYNNWCDIDRLLQTVTHIAAGWEVNFGSVPPIAVGGKHGNACGAGVDNGHSRVIEQMLEGDPIAIMGGLVMVNFPVGGDVADKLLHHGMSGDNRRLLDGVIAPSFTEEARELLARKKGKCRLLVNPALRSLTRESLDRVNRFRYVRGGFLRQPNYTFVPDLRDTEIAFYEGESGLSPAVFKCDLVLAWAIGSTSNSNTITLVRDCMLIGNGVGQQDRVFAAETAVRRAERAHHKTQGSVAYSDSFFPFIDGPEVLAEAGIVAILASSGSMSKANPKDAAVIEACRQRNVALFLIPDKKGRGFFGH